MKGVGDRMRVVVLGLLLVFMLVGQAGADDLNVYWKDGLRADSEDGAFKIKFGGRIMLDMAWFDVDAALDDEEDPLDEAVEFRRARLYFSGTICDAVEFKAQYDFDASEADLIGIEAAAVFGPVSVQGEYIMAAVQSDASGDPDFAGYSVEASYFFTGEHRRYKLSEGAFDRVKPSQNLMADGGFGAVQLTARYSSVDLTNGAIEGGEMDDITVGINWYLNPNTRVMLNYVTADVDGVGEADIIQTRFQIDF